MPSTSQSYWTRNEVVQGDEGNGIVTLMEYEILILYSYFHGVPMLIKDNIATADKLEATAGSYALVGAKPAKEASVISRLRKAGAIILGKTNLSEWANFRSATSSNGWSARGGQTIGTYYPGSDPSGSSSGSGVAASLGLCVVTLGSEV
jgi:amidase